MNKVISIYEAKTNLSKLVKRASAGETIYVGAYGQAQAVLTALPKKTAVTLGVLAHLAKPGDFNDNIISSDPDIVKDFDVSVSRQLP